MSSPSKSAPKKRNLIVNYIPSHLKEEQLFELFASMGSIQSLRIMRNSDGTGKGYGFVEYQDYVSAANAIVQFDGLQLGGKKLKVAFARPGGSREGSNLFVKNIPSTWTTDKLTYEFGKFGELLESRVLSTNDFQSRRCGFVRFDLPRDAFNAMKALNGYIPTDGDFQIKVTYATKRRGRLGSFDPEPASSFEVPMIRHDFQQYSSGKRDDRQYTNYVPPTFPPYTTPAEQSYEAFRAPLSSIDLDYIDASYPGPRSLGYDPYNERNQSRNAYLASASERVAVNSIDDYSGTTDASLSKNSSSTKDTAEEEDHANKEVDDRETTMMIANLPTFLEEVHLMHICKKYGKVTSMVIQRDNNNNNLGCVTVTFDSVEAKKAAQKGLDGCLMGNQTIVCH